MNRGSAAERIARRTLKVASMRPRFMNRGSSIDRERSSGQSRRFNEAPIHESGK